MKLRVLAVLPAFIPSTIIDVTTPLIDLHRSNLIDARITLEMFVSQKDIKWCDIVILCRNTEPATAEWFLQVLELRKPYIYDIDDNFFELTEGTSLGEYHQAPDRIKLLKEYIRLADLVRAYSEPLRARAAHLNPNVTRVTAPIDLRLISSARKTGREAAVKIVYATSRINDSLAGVFMPALKRVLHDYPGRVQVYFLGYNPPEFREHTNVIFKPMRFNYRSYLQEFSGAGYDIGLAPLLNDAFYRSKTNNKFREYAASRIAGIYSEVDVYSSCVVHGETGLLVKNNPRSWYAAMSRLIENSGQREQIQQQAYEFVVRNYSQVAFVDMWYQQMTRITTPPRKRKLSSKAVEKLIASYSGRHGFQINDLLGWFVSLKTRGPSSKRAQWVLQKFIGLVRDVPQYWFSHGMVKIRHYLFTVGMLWEIRMRLYFERSIRRKNTAT